MSIGHSQVINKLLDYGLSSRHTAPVVPCCCEFACAVDAQFTRKKAAQELARYRKSGPGITTTLLRDGLVKAGLTSGSLLDVGSGVGALTFELLDRGFSSAVAVDASGPYLSAAKEEAARRVRSSALSFVHGDFVELPHSSRRLTSSRSIASSAAIRITSLCSTKPWRTQFGASPCLIHESARS